MFKEFIKNKDTVQIPLPIAKIKNNIPKNLIKI